MRDYRIRCIFGDLYLFNLSFDKNRPPGNQAEATRPGGWSTSGQKIWLMQKY